MIPNRVVGADSHCKGSEMQQSSLKPRPPEESSQSSANKKHFGNPLLENYQRSLTDRSTPQNRVRSFSGGESHAAVPKTTRDGAGDVKSSNNPRGHSSSVPVVTKARDVLLHETNEKISLKQNNQQPLMIPCSSTGDGAVIGNQGMPLPSRPATKESIGSLGQYHLSGPLSGRLFEGLITPMIDESPKKIDAKAVTTSAFNGTSPGGVGIRSRMTLQLNNDGTNELTSNVNAIGIPPVASNLSQDAGLANCCFAEKNERMHVSVLDARKNLMDANPPHARHQGQSNFCETLFPAHNEDLVKKTQREYSRSVVTPPQGGLTSPAEHSTTSVIVEFSPILEREQAERCSRNQEWLQVPCLFYLFANLIKFHELQKEKRNAEAREREGSPSLGSSWNSFYQAQLAAYQNHVSYSLFQIQGTLLNQLFTSWPKGNLKTMLIELIRSWKVNGSDSTEFEEASFILLDAISTDRQGKVRYTLLFFVYQFLGGIQNVSLTFGLLTAFAILEILCIVFLDIFGRDSLTPCIVLSVVMGLFVVIGYVLTLLLLHHNAYADATANFFYEEALAVSKDIISDDREMGSSFSGHESDVWSSPLDLESHGSSRGRSVGRGDRIMLGIDDKPLLMQPKITQQRQLEKDRNNSVLMTGINYDKHHERVQEYYEKVLRNRLTAGSPSEEGDKITDGEHISQRLVTELSNSINITALVYCMDPAVLAPTVASLWERNFCVLRCSFNAIDHAYGIGSERFKVILLHAPDLVLDSVQVDTALSWLVEKRPVFFFSHDIRSFPPHVPRACQLEVPFTEEDLSMLLLSGIGVDEDLKLTVNAVQPFKVPAYTLGRRLGGGAYGNVFEAELEDTKATCAVKRIYLKENGDTSEGDLDGPTSQLREIAQEVEIMSSLSHPNIVRYMFCERDDNCISIFMELCSGGSLSSMIARGGLTDPNQIKSILSDTINAVTYLHSKRIVHRDLKPDNVLFRDGRAKVTDFGTAVLKRERGDLHLVKGTFAYMAPEILVGEPYGKPCDVWSVGCIISEVLSVELPQRGLGLPEMCNFYRQMSINSALGISCDVISVRDFLKQCLQRDPNARPTMASLMSHEILHPDNTSIAQWMDIVHERQRLHRLAGSPSSAFAGSCSLLDGSSDNNSLKSSMLLSADGS